MSRNASDESTEYGADEFALLVHDIRGCLHALRMGRELLKQMCSDEKLSDVCDAMESEERKAAQLLDKLLLAARRRQ
jgi:signal transduction histidine kinase